MPTTALDKVITALKAAIEATPDLDGVQVDTDRPEDDAYGKGELPAINLIYRGCSEESVSNAETLNRARFDLDMIVAVEAASTNAARLRTMEAHLVKALWDNRGLGALGTDIDWDSREGDDDVRADEGARPLSIEVRYLTAHGDPFTILGASGPVP